MAEDTNAREWRVVTDREAVRELAEEHQAVPLETEGPSGGLDLRVAPNEEEVEGERLTWAQFYERLEATDQVVRYHPPEKGLGSTSEFDVVSSTFIDDQRTGDMRADDRQEARPDEPSDVDYDQLATGDTGDSEPVEFDETETERDGPNRITDESTSSTGDQARAPTSAGAGLVLDEIHESSLRGSSDIDDEYVVFENDGEEVLDMSKWVVENEDGRSYRFPSGFTLHPGNRVTLHSGDGEDDEGHLYWNADEPVWGDRGDTILVETPTGDRVLRERFEA